jgi:hypothetical protein
VRCARCSFANGRPPPSKAAWKVGDGFDVLVQVHVASAEVPVRLALPRPVAHLLCNRQVLPVVVDGPAEVPLRPIRDAEVPIRHALRNRLMLPGSSIAFA